MGDIVGDGLGALDITNDGFMEDIGVGPTVGAVVGTSECSSDGKGVGLTDGSVEGDNEYIIVGLLEGVLVGPGDGSDVVGCLVGAAVGILLASALGLVEIVGDELGASDATTEGAIDGVLLKSLASTISISLHARSIIQITVNLMPEKVVVLYFVGESAATSRRRDIGISADKEAKDCRRGARQKNESTTLSSPTSSGVSKSRLARSQ
eukprot:scaffold45786_cov176-Amphora_coffeaeformis.AAC.1